MWIGKQLLTKLKDIKLIPISLALFCVLLMTFLVFSVYIPTNYSLNENEVATFTIVSPHKIEFESSLDKIKIKQKRDHLIASIGKIYTIDTDINTSIQAQFDIIFNELETLRRSTKPSDIKPKNFDYLPKKTFLYVVSLSPHDWSSLKYITLQTNSKLLSEGLKEIHPESIKQKIKKHIRLLDLNTQQQLFIIHTNLTVLKPNLLFNQEKTRDVINKALANETQIKTLYKEGQPIIYKGEKVTKSHIEALKALNIYGVKTNFYKGISIFLFCGLCYLLLERFIFYFSPKFHTKIRYFVLIFTLMVLVILIARFFQSSKLLPPLFNTGFLIPIAMASMIASFLMTPNLSLLIGTIISVFVALMYDGNFELFLFLFFCNATTTFATYRIYKRSELIFSGYIIGIFNILFIICIGLFKEINVLLWYGANSILGFANGVLSSMFSLAILPYLESVFKLTTSQNLLELANLNHPLLKRLMMTAPGTYQHSLMVATLAEGAAESIQADPVICRVGAYFHDIGKMKRPLFFYENQFNKENPHATLSPHISKMIISSHTKDGVELAQKHKLPKILQDIMVQHHGTSLVSFFYNQAKIVNTDAHSTTEDDFRYPGPKPQFKESGIIMLADSIEAAIRSIEKPTQTKVENLINKIFQERLDDGQLNECPLTLKEINMIKESFLRVLQGIHHSRLDYQSELDAIIKSTHDDDDTNK